MEKGNVPFFWCLFFLSKGDCVAGLVLQLSPTESGAGMVAQGQPSLLPRSVLAGGKWAEKSPEFLGERMGFLPWLLSLVCFML